MLVIVPWAVGHISLRLLPHSPGTVKTVPYEWLLLFIISFLNNY